VSGAQLTLVAVEAAEDVELVDAELVPRVESAASATAVSPFPLPFSSALDERNLFGEAERIALGLRRRSSAPSRLVGRSAARRWSAMLTPM